MTTFKLLAAWAAIGATVIATPAHAGWRFTQWGMTAEQVIAASEGKVGPRDPNAIAEDLALKERLTAAGLRPSQNACSHRLLEPLMVGGIEFDDIQFCFSTAGRLTVVLTRSRSSAQEVERVLVQALGQAVDFHRGEFPAWTFVDRERRNTLLLEPLPEGGSTIAYKEIASGF